jgi:alpha-tubulin suppressor-like RCC1 family protein
MWKNLKRSALLLTGAVLFGGCQDRQITVPGTSSEGDGLARLLQPGQFEHPCGATMTLTLRNAAGAQIGQVAVWNGPTTAYVRITAQRAWELTEVRVGGARQPEQFPRTGGVVDPSRFQFGGLVSPTQGEVVIEALHLDNPFNVLPGDEVLLAVFVRLRPVGGGESVSAWAEGTPFQPGQHPMYLRFTLRECAPPPAPGRISAGMDHTCALTASGTAYCWGWNAHGQLGDGTTIDRSVPTPVAGGLRFTSISAVWSHTCGLTPEGEAYCWGGNGLGQLGDGTTINRHVPTPVAGGLRFATLAGRMGSHTCGLTLEGIAYCWGYNGWGQLGDGTTINRHVPTPVAGGLRFTTISAVNHTCGITPEGAAYCWGWNNTGRVGDGTTIDRHVPTAVTGGHLFAGISAGLAHTCAFTPDGDAFCWGGNSSGELGTGFIGNRTFPVAVVGDLRFAGISAGSGHSCGSLPNGAAYCWGRNSWGQIGDGTTTDRLVPTPVTGGLHSAIVSAGGGHTCSLTTYDGAYCWGYNIKGKLGDGTYTNRLIPTPVYGWGNLTALPSDGNR